MEWIRSRAIAHRGLHNSTIPENSIAAFEAAIEQNYPIELDLQLMSDGNLAVFHDSDLERMTGVSGNIQAQTRSSIKEFNLLNSDQGIPLLEEALELINGRVPVLIEIKNEGTVGELEANLWQKLQSYRGEYAIQSFNPYSLGWFKENGTGVTRGQLATDFSSTDLIWYQKLLLGNLLLNWVSKPHFIAYDLRYLPNLPTAIARRVFNLPLVAWTVRSKVEEEQAKRYADNIIFDYY